MPIQIPIGREDKFAGIVDLVEMKAYYYGDDQGTTFTVVDIPDDCSRPRPRSIATR